ncbi:hypothetical protein [Chryseobacterium cucumeris]|uniref:hypothetical protein n=1 Tax=Chryseobacterium cucumeris TaxID=1813611 RepID=UPI003D97E637
MKTFPKKTHLTRDNIWLKEPEDHDFPAAQDYLELLFQPDEVEKMVEKLKAAPTIIKKSKDILSVHFKSLWWIFFKSFLWFT